MACTADAHVSVTASPDDTPDAGADVLASPTIWTGGFHQVGNFTMYLGVPAADPSAPGAYPNASGGLIADVSGDGQADVVTFTEGGAWRVDVTGGASLSGQLPPIRAVAVMPRLGGPLLLLAGQHLTAMRIADGKATSVPLGVPDDASVERYALTVADIDQDGLADLLVGRYRCNAPGAPLVLLDRGDGELVEQGSALGVTATGSQWGMLAGDLDEDGDPDLMLLHDGCGNPQTTQVFLRNDGRGAEGWPTFTRTAPHELYTFPKPIMPFASPMGGATGDFDGDGRFDLVLANVGLPMSIEAGRKLLMTDDPALARLAQNLLLHAQPDGKYVDIGLSAGLKTLTDFDPAKHVDLTAWSVAALDFDRDGWLDLALSNAPEREAFFAQNRGPMRPVLMRNQGDGTLVEVSAQAGLPAPRPGMTLSAGDYDGDGDDDLLFGGLDAQPFLLRNDVVHGRHGLRVRLHGTVSNLTGLGAIVVAKAGGVTQRRLVGGAAPFATMHEPVADFGVGTAASVDFEIHWPSGLQQNLTVAFAPGATAKTVDVTEPLALHLDKRVLHGAGTVHVTTQTPAQIDVIPKGLLTVKAIACQPDGPCAFELVATQALQQPTFAFVRATVDGHTLKIWPHVLLLPQ